MAPNRQCSFCGRNYRGIQCPYCGMGKEEILVQCGWCGWCGNVGTRTSCPRCGSPLCAHYQKPEKIDISFDCWVIDKIAFKFNEELTISTKNEFLLLANESLKGIMEWHKKLGEKKQEVIDKKNLCNFIVNNRMENIKKVLKVFRDEGLLKEELASNYAITHMLIEKDWDDHNWKEWEPIYKLFIEYISATYDCFNSIGGYNLPTSTELRNNKSEENDEDKDILSR